MTTYYFQEANLGFRQYDGAVIVTPTLSRGITLSLIIKSGVTVNNVKLSPQYIDLTLLNPTLAAKDNLTVAEVEAYIASIRTPKPYYAQNAGTLLGAKMLGHLMPKTPNLLNPTTKQARLCSYAWDTTNDNRYTIKNLPSDAAVKFVEDKVGDNLPQVTNLIRNYNFADGGNAPTYWTDGFGTTIDNSNPDYISLVGQNFYFQYAENPLDVGHKVLYKIRARYGTANTNGGIIFSAVNNAIVQSLDTNGSWTTIKTIGTTINNGQQSNYGVIRITLAQSKILIDKKFGVHCYDLTSIFGEGNEPATVAEAEAALFGIVTPDANGHFIIPSTGTASIVNASDNQPYSGSGNLAATWLIMTYDETKDDYEENFEPFELSAADIDSAKIYYDNDGTMTQVFTDGILRATGDGADDVRDRVWFDEVEKKWKSEVKVGDQDLGAQNIHWYYSAATEQRPASRFNAEIVDIKEVTLSVNTSNLSICNRYFVDKYVTAASSYYSLDKVLYRANNDGLQGKKICVQDSAYTSAESFKTAMSGVHLWYELNTPITHNTLYYKIGDNYLPMEQVFPNGIANYGCNWATESLIEEAEVSGQPQSITPMTTEVFQSDYKELLKTIGDTYISKAQAKDSFDNLLTALNTNSGTALGGTYATDGFNDDGSVKFVFTPTT